MTEEDVRKLYIIYPAEHPGHLSEAAQAGVFVLLPHSLIQTALSCLYMGSNIIRPLPRKHGFH